MAIQKKIKVLVIDDSKVFREMIANSISNDAGIEVVGTASDPFNASEKIIDLEPDVLTLDVEMPKMNGIDFLKKLMPQYPLPTVVVSSTARNVLDALNAGAVDFVEKPVAGNPNSMKMFINELIIKIKIASVAKVGHFKKDAKPSVSKVKNGSGKCCDDIIVAIGASTGGTEALYNVIKALPVEMPGIVVVQHMPPVFTRMYAERLNNSCRLHVKEAQNGDTITSGKVLVAPGDFQMKIGRDNDKFYVRCLKEEKVNGHCPSVDVLFDSVAKFAEKKAVGVILTGMGGDGAKGLLNMRKSGAYTIGQDEKSSVVYGMPMVAYNIGAVQKQVPLDKIPGEIMNALSKFK